MQADEAAEVLGYGPAGTAACAAAVAAAGFCQAVSAGWAATAAGSRDPAESPATARGAAAGRNPEAAAGCRPQQECTSIASYCSQFRCPAAKA